MSDHAAIPPEGTSLLTNNRAMEMIQGVLSGKEWSSDTADMIAQLMRLAGYEIYDIQQFEVRVSISFLIEAHDEDQAMIEGVNMAKDVQHNDYQVEVSRFDSRPRRHDETE